MDFFLPHKIFDTSNLHQMHLIRATLQDPRFLALVPPKPSFPTASVNSNGSETVMTTMERADGLGELLRSYVDDVGDISPALAPIHFHYGSLCLRQVEENLDILGAGSAAKSSQVAEKIMKQQLEQQEQEEKEKNGKSLSLIKLLGERRRALIIFRTCSDER
jgi:hypothetical protein